MTNQEIANRPDFQKLCSLVGIPSSVRQASKYRNNKGMAFKGLTSREVWGLGAERNINNQTGEPYGPAKAQIRPICKRK
jgi:hypothetical protein